MPPNYLITIILNPLHELMTIKNIMTPCFFPFCDVFYAHEFAVLMTITGIDYLVHAY